MVRRLTCLQVDPTRAVERTERLVLWSRLGRYDTDLLRRLQEDRRTLVEYWAHEASLVLAEDWAIHQVLMRSWPPAGRRGYDSTREWLRANRDFRRSVLEQLRRSGPLPAAQIQGAMPVAYRSGGWNDGRSAGRLLELMWVQGEVSISRREGGHRLWDLMERCLPDQLARTEVAEDVAVRRAAARSVRALGVCSARDITRYFTRGRYPGLPDALVDLQRSGEIVPIEVEGLKLDRYAHAHALEEIDAIERGEWQPRTTLLSPFDNLVADRRRTEELWDFRFRLEIYTPKHKREYGYFVLPLLHGDSLVGRVDAVADRRAGALTLVAVHLEAGVRPTKGLATALRRSARDLAAFVGATAVEVGTAPPGWRETITA